MHIGRSAGNARGSEPLAGVRISGQPRRICALDVWNYFNLKQTQTLLTGGTEDAPKTATGGKGKEKEGIEDRNGGSDAGSLLSGVKQGTSTRLIHLAILIHG